MISIFTPTNNCQWLEEAYDSLLAQSIADWEWIIVPNESAVVPERITEESRVRIIPSDAKTVGALKRYACEQSRGDILVELDHDDLLTPDCLEETLEAFEDPAIGFVYSNHAIFWDETWDANEFGGFWGWEYRDFECYGHKFREALGFPPTAHSVSIIYFAPNHVRAWRREVYWKAGGHDPDYLIIDDHDLVARTYLTTQFAFIDECLYLQRYHKEQGFRRYNQRIQELTREVRNKYLGRLIARWCELESLPRIDICCGDAKPEGYIGVDKFGGDVPADLDERWPFDDNSIGCIRAYDALEHLKDKTHTMNEAYRVLVPGGWFITLTPSTDGRGAFQDPTHVSYWNENSFWYYTDQKFAKYDREIKCKFQDIRYRYTHGDKATFFPSDWHKEHDIPYVRMDLVALKDGAGRQPGPRII